MCNQVDWLKNDEPLRVDIPHKYQVVGNGTQLRVRNIGYADTGAYMCQATSVGGMARDISSLIVQENPAPSTSFCVYDTLTFEHGAAITNSERSYSAYIKWMDE